MNTSLGLLLKFFPLVFSAAVGYKIFETLMANDLKMFLVAKTKENPSMVRRNPKPEIFQQKYMNF